MMRFATATAVIAAVASAEGENSLPDFSLATARAFASIVEATYCGPMANMTSWTCDPCLESGVSVQPGSVRLMSFGELGDEHADFAFVTRLGSNAGPGPLENGCVVAIRGSEDTANFITDIQGTYDSMSDVCEGCKAEHGFHSLWHKIDDEIIEQLSKIGCVPGGDPLFITGHSLGAAVATVATLELFVRGFDVRASYAFESPRVLNTAGAEFFDSLFNGKDVWRITHRSDIIPSYPLGFGYRHTGQEVYFDKDDEHHLCASYQECEQYKPYFRLSVRTDHCGSPLVPNDLCTCRDWVEVIPGQNMVV